jgi:hypothetical protein
VKGVVEGFPTKLDLIQLGLWISRYGNISVKDTLCKIKYQKENTLNFWQTTYSACLVTCSRSIRKLDILSLWRLPIYLGFITCSKFLNRSEKE